MAGSKCEHSIGQGHVDANIKSYSNRNVPQFILYTLKLTIATPACLPASPLRLQHQHLPHPAEVVEGTDNVHEQIPPSHNHSNVEIEHHLYLSEISALYSNVLIVAKVKEGPLACRAVPIVETDDDDNVYGDNCSQGC